MAKPYFTPDGYFTNPQGFISLKKAVRFGLLFSVLITPLCKHSKCLFSVMYRLRRNDVDYSVISDVARFTRSDVMFAFHFGEANTSLDEVKHHYEVTSLAKQTSLKKRLVKTSRFFCVKPRKRCANTGKKSEKYTNTQANCGLCVPTEFIFRVISNAIQIL